MCSPTGPIHPSSSLMCKYLPLQINLSMICIDVLDGGVFNVLHCVCFRPTERELTERQIKTSLREIMMQKDLENVTCKEVGQIPKTNILKKKDSFDFILTIHI